MRRNYNEFRNVWFSWEDKISITIMDFSILLVRKYEWLEKERSNWLVQVIGPGKGTVPFIQSFAPWTRRLPGPFESGARCQFFGNWFEEGKA